MWLGEGEGEGKGKGESESERLHSNTTQAGRIQIT